MSLFSTYNLKIGYRYKEEKELQRNINVVLDKGQIVSLIGQNGVGKTTFIKTISGLLPPLHGQIFYGDQEISSISKTILATRFSIVLTERPTSANLTVKEIVALGRHPYSSWLGTLSEKDKDAVRAAIDKTRINYIVDKKLYQLSDGQLQKVMIARALAQETDLIFLDEPTAHLDLHNKIEIMYLLKEIAAEGKGILISTHDLHISTQISDVFWLFNFNEPVLKGTPEDLILDGSIEKTLFLEEYDYDFKTGFSFIKSDKKINIQGKGDRRFWAEIALRKRGIDVSTEHNEVDLIEVTSDSFILKRKGQQPVKVYSIEELLKIIPQ